MDIDTLAAKYGGAEPKTRPSSSDGLDIEGLAAKYGGGSSTPVVAPQASTIDNIVAGVGRGVTDVLDTVGSGIGFIDKTVDSLFKNGGAERAQKFQERINKNKEEYDVKYGDSTAADIGRIGGQVAATAPLVPARAVQGINALSGALPTILASGERVAAPLINRVGALVANSTLGGAIFGGATSEARKPGGTLDEYIGGTGANIAENALMGAVGGPIAHGAITAGSKLAGVVRNIWDNTKIVKAVKDTGISPSAAKNIVMRLDEAGYSVDDAADILRKMGPKATIADLDPMLTTEASGLAALGGKPTALLKNVFNDRSTTANASAKEIIEQRLGVKPNLDNEIQTVKTQAKLATSADYKAAHASPIPVDISSVVTNLESRLTNSVGRETNVLNEVKEYLFKDGKLKSNVSSLIKVRQGIDDLIDRLPSEGTTAKSNTFKAVVELRKTLDTELKTNPQLRAADEKFAEAMKVAKGLQIGADALKSPNYDKFEKIFSSASPETKEAIRKGLRVAIGDTMDRAEQGELTSAIRMFDKKSVNKRILQLAFPNEADAVINAIRQEGAFKATEKAITSGSQTAERLAVGERYKGRTGLPEGILGSAVQGAAIDLATGAPALAAVTMASRNVGRGLHQRFLNVLDNNLAQGSADLLSRQGIQRDSTMSVLRSVSDIQDKISQPKPLKIKLPITGGAPLIEYTKRSHDK